MKALETEFKGILYRSRAEARWAVFMDALGVKFHYEMEGFDLGDGVLYLPDFFLPTQDIWFEVKGENPTREEREKADRLCAFTNKSVFIMVGPPAKGSQAEVYFPPHESTDMSVSWDDSYEWCECPVCGRVELQYSGRWERIGCDCNKDSAPDMDRILKALSSAQRERFGT